MFLFSVKNKSNASCFLGTLINMSMFVTFLNAEQAVSIFFFLIYLAFHVLRLKGREKIEIDQRLEHEFFTKILNTYVAIYG